MTLNPRDYERVGEAISQHLQTGQFDTCLSLLKTMKIALDALMNTGASGTGFRQVFQQTSMNVKEILLANRQQVDEEQYRTMLSLFEESLVLSTVIQPIPEPSAAHEEVYLSTSEAAQKLGVSTQSILNMIRDGRIKAERPFGTHYKIPASQFADGDRKVEQVRSDLDRIHAKIGQEITDEDLEEL